jgi:hypothetical protein
MIPGGVSIAERLPGVTFPVRADHFQKSLEIPKGYRKIPALDDTTFVYGTHAGYTLTYSFPQEEFLVRKFYVKGDSLIFVLESKSQYHHPYGLEFHFVYPRNLLEPGQYVAVVHEIDPYLLPVDEYKTVSAKAQEGAKHIDIQPGMSKEEVVKRLGEPLKTITFGTKTILKYQDITVELEDGKVKEVKAN